MNRSDTNESLHPGWLATVDVRAADRDCVGLQEVFDNADARERNSSVKVDKLRHVDKVMREIGCY